MKVINAMVANNREFHRKLFYYKTNETNLYFSMALAANCPGARCAWHAGLAKPTDSLAFLTDNNLFYPLFVTQDVTLFYLCAFDELLESLNRCLIYNYAEGIEIPEQLVISRMEDLKRAFTVLPFAIFKKRPKLEEKALAFIHHYEFYVIAINDQIIYSALNVSQIAMGDYASKCTADSFLDYHENKPLTKVNVSSIQFIASEGRFSVVTGSSFSFPRTMPNKWRVAFEGDTGVLRVTKNSHLSQNEILGIMAAYHFKGIEFDGYSEATFDFLEKVSQLVPELQSLTFLNKDDIKSETLSLLPILFLNLGELAIANKRIHAKALKDIFECTNIHTLELYNCTLFLPETCPPLDHIRILNVGGSIFKSGSIDLILTSAKALTILHAVYIAGFALSQCAYPEHICEMGVDASQLKISNGKIEGLEKFKSLNKIYLSGILSSALKVVLAEIIRENKIMIEFVGSD